MDHKIICCLVQQQIQKQENRCAIKMGNICTQIRKESNTVETTESVHKNWRVCEYDINKWCKLQLILGTYRNHRADLLLVFAQPECMEYSSEIKEYAQNYLELIENPNLHKKNLINVHVNRSCSYKRLVVVMLPVYNSQYSDMYYQQFEQIVEEILASCSQFTLQIHQTPQNGNGVPNQTLISLFIKYLREYSKPIKIYMISSELRLLNMARYQMAKLGVYVPMINKDKD